MFGSYIKVAVRQFRRLDISHLLNLLGLTVSLSVALLLFLYVRNELSFDRSHPQRDNLYRIISRVTIDGNEINTPTSPDLLGAALDSLDYCRVHVQHNMVIGLNGEIFNEDNIYFVDPSFFSFFNPSLVKGTVNGLTREDIVLTEPLARKLFGIANPIGKRVKVNSQIRNVAALVRSPVQSHFNYGALMLMGEADDGGDWSQFSVYTYLRSSLPANSIKPALDAAYDHKMKDLFVSRNSSCHFGLQKVTEIHLNSHLQSEFKVNSSRRTIYAFLLVGFFLVVMTAINFSNTTTARYLRRSTEIGIRKTVGSLPDEIFLQILIESVLMVLLGAILGLIIVDQVVRHFIFMHFTGLSSTNGFEFLDWQLLVFLVLMVLFVGGIGGLFPAMVFTRNSPSDALKGLYHPRPHKPGFRRVFVTIQIMVSVYVVIGTLFVHNQITFINTYHMGFSPSQTIALPLPSDSNDQVTKIKESFLKTGLVSTVCTVERLPGRSTEKMVNFLFNGDKPAYKQVLATYFFADKDFVHTLDLKILKGTNLDLDLSSEIKVLVNRSFAEEIGFESTIGSQLILPFGTGSQNSAVIIGIVDDFQYGSVQEEIRPTVIVYRKVNEFLLVRVKDSLGEFLPTLESVWQNEFPRQPFDYEFLEDRISRLYEPKLNTAHIFGVISIITLFLAWSGIYTFSYYRLEMRKKEIGIRKINGAGIVHLILLSHKEYVVPLLIGLFISWPAAYLSIKEWLSNFINQTSISIWPFIISLVLVLIIITVTLTINTIKISNEKMVPIINRG